MSLISITVQDENGKQLGERVDCSSAVFPSAGDTRFTCLRFVDPYGDTVFNQIQIPVILEDLCLLKECDQGQAHQVTILRLEALCRFGQTEPHLYLKFVGD